MRLIANNTRFLILPQVRVASLASRALSLSFAGYRTIRSRATASQYSHPVLLAETLVAPLRFVGACYRASTWLELGETRGYVRSVGGRLGGAQRTGADLGVPADRQYASLVAASGRSASPGVGATQPVGEAPNKQRLRNLFGDLREAPEYRLARGTRHSLASVLAVTVAGYCGVTAIGEFAVRLDQKQLRAAPAFPSPTSGRRYPPSRSSLHRILSEPDPEVLKRAVRDRVAQTGGLDCVLVPDGKSAPAHRTAGESDRCLIVAVEHGAGAVRSQVSANGFAGSEIVAARQLIEELDVAGWTLTLDALHSCRKTAALIVARQADYVLVVKGNRPTMCRTCRRFDGTARAITRPSTRATADLECDVLAPGDNYEGFVALPGHRQAFRIVRERTVLKTGKTTTETVYGVTSLSSDMAGPSEVLARVRGHREIGNRVHYVRDFSYDEDRGRIRKGRLSRNPVCLTNAVIPIVRLKGRFRHQPQANRHYAATRLLADLQGRCG